MPDQPKGFDPQQPAPGGSTQGQSQQQGPADPQEDQELSQFLQDQHGHTKQTADAEVKRDREGVKKKKKEHEAKHGSSSHGR